MKVFVFYYLWAVCSMTTLIPVFYFHKKTFESSFDMKKQLLQQRNQLVKKLGSDEDCKQDSEGPPTDPSSNSKVITGSERSSNEQGLPTTKTESLDLFVDFNIKVKKSY